MMKFIRFWKVRLSFQRTLWVSALALALDLSAQGGSSKTAALQEPPPDSTAPPARSQAERDSLIASGERQLRAGELGEAVALFTRLVEAYPHDAHLLTRLGHAHLRGRNFEAAERAFTTARRLDPRLPDACVGLGLVYAEMPARGMRAYYNFRRAVGEARRAIRLDATYGPAYRLLGEVYERFRGDSKKAVEYYTKYVERTPEDPDGLYFFGLACVQARDYEKIERHIAPYLQSYPGEIRLLPLAAQAYFFEERHDLALRYFERYLQSLEDRERQFYIDISLVASEKELQTYRSISEETERQAYLGQFWAHRDPDILTGINERILEHYRRVWYARTFFADQISPWDRRGEVYIRYGEPDFRSRSIQRQVNLDPQVEALRSRVAVEMYGHEAAYLTFTGPVFPIRTRNASYDTVPEDLLVRPDDPSGLARLDEDPLTGEGTIPAAGETAVAPVPTTPERPDLSRFDESMTLKLQLNFNGYAPVTVDNAGALVPWETWAYTQIRGGMEIVFTDETGNGQFDFAPIPPVSEGKRQIRSASRIREHAPEAIYRNAVSESPDHYWPGAQGPPFNFYYDTASFQAPDGKTTLEVYYGIPTGRVEIHRDADSSFIHVKCSLALADEGRTRTYREATEAIYQGGADLNQNRGAFFPELLKLQVDPGTYELQVQVKDLTSRKTGFYRQPVEVRNYRTGELQISDIQFASAISDTASDERFRKGDISVLPMPTRTYRKDQKVYAYYEIYNLQKDPSGQTRYRVQYQVWSSARSGRGVVETAAKGLRSLLRTRKSQVSVAYDQVGKAAVEQKYFEIDLSRLKPDVNTLQVTITDEVGGRSATRETRFRYGRE